MQMQDSQFFWGINTITLLLINMRVVTLEKCKVTGLCFLFKENKIQFLHFPEKSSQHHQWEYLVQSIPKALQNYLNIGKTTAWDTQLVLY